MYRTFTKKRMIYTDKEQEIRFVSEGSFFHINSPENFGTIFRNKEDFENGLLIYALCNKQLFRIRTLAFELMNNHFHALLKCTEQEAGVFFNTFAKHLHRYCSDTGNYLEWDNFICHTTRITTLENLKNVIAYIHRNGAMVNPQYTPYNYPWGSNRFFFNPDTDVLYEIVKKRITVESIRKTTHSRCFDSIKDIYSIGDTASPLCFVDIKYAESFFRDARQYFFKISRDVENYKAIAEMIGESVYYVDEELFSIAYKISLEQFGNAKISQLPPREKIQLARALHCGYNAGLKQLQRILHLDGITLKQLFNSIEG